MIESLEKRATYRLSLKELSRAIDSPDLPKVRVRNLTHSVDRIGVIHVGRMWPVSNAPLADQIELAKTWLADAVRTKTAHFGINSYFAKHLAERSVGDYVSNGALIVAASELGFAMSFNGLITANPQIAISRKWIKKLPEYSAILG